MNSRKSYLKIILPIAGLSAASIAVFTFPSCDSPNGKSLAEPQDTPAGLYREYLSEIRKSQELSFEELTVCIGEWQTLKDSVAAAIRQDTARQAHSGTRKNVVCYTTPFARNFPGWPCRNRAPTRKC